MASKLALLTLFADLLEPTIAQSASATFAPTFTFDAWVQHATLNADAGCVIQNIVNVASANACLAYTATGYTAVEFVSNAFCYCWSGSCTSANVVFNQAQTASVYIPTPPTPSYSPTASMTVSMTPTKLATMSFTPTHAGSSTASPTPSHLSPGTASPSSSSSAYPPTASATFVPPSFQYDTWLRFARLGGNGCNLAAYSLDATSAADCLANYSAGYAAVEYFQPFCESYTGSCTAANVVFDQTAWNEYVYVPSPPTPSHTPSVTPTASATFAPTFVYDTWMQYAAISSGANCYMVSGTTGLTAAECLANYSGYTALNYDDGGYCWPFAGSCTAANVAFDQAASYSYIYVPTPPSESSTPSNSPTPSHTPSNLATPSHTPSNLPTPTSTFAPAFAYNTWVQYAALAHVVGCDYAGAVGGTTADACLDYIAAGYVAVASAGSFCQYFTGNCTAADVVFFSYASYEFLYIRAPPTATSTPSSSPAGTSSSSCTSSSSATATASSTNTPPATVPASGSGTPSATSPASVSSTPSRSHSLSATRTSTPSRTKPPSPSKSGSKSASLSKTSSRSAKVTSTPTRSATRSKTRASTPSPTRSRSATRKLKAL